MYLYKYRWIGSLFLVPYSQFSTHALALSYRFSLEFCFLGKMKTRGMGINSSSGSNSAFQRQIVGVNRRVNKGVERDSRAIEQTSSQKMAGSAEQQIQSLSTTTSSYETEFPSLLDSVCAGSKRRTRIDLRLHSEQRSDQGAEQAPLANLESSLRPISVTPNSSNSSALPTDSGKAFLSFPSCRAHLHRNSPETGKDMRNSGVSKPVNVNEAFDICLSGRRPAVIKPSLHGKDSLQGIQMDYPFENGEVLRPGMVLFRSYIPLREQVDIVMRCRKLGLGSGGFYRPGYHDGAKLRLHMMCLGLDWDPETRKYGKKRHNDNSEPSDIPPEFKMLVKRALHDSHTLLQEQSRINDVEEILPVMSPDVCIVNFYTCNGRLGLHQDRDESKGSLLKGLPVVSFSIGDSAEFVYGDQRDVDKAERVLLESGDVLIFGGKSRHIFHGVTSIYPKTAPRALLEYTKLRSGRLNLTFRKD